MNFFGIFKNEVIQTIKEIFNVDDELLKKITLTLNQGKDAAFGDLSCNAAMMLAKPLNRNPREIAAELVQQLTSRSQDENRPEFFRIIEKIEIAGPGFLNITLNKNFWTMLALEFFQQKDMFFQLDIEDPSRAKYLIEFVSANPTGPLHLGHGRGGIIGDTLARVLNFLGHDAQKEFYINDAGNQMLILGKSLKARCLQELGQQAELPEEGYAGQYMIDLAKTCIGQLGRDVIKNDDKFFTDYAKEKMLEQQQKDLAAYRINFDRWYSEKSLHDSGAVDKTIEILQKSGLVYEQEGALWFKSTEFGDDKDRVVKKSDGSWTYIAPDIAYHKEKFDRGYDQLINVLGQDHHGYVKRLQSTMQALGYAPERLGVILYQLVTIKENDVVVRMSKRAGKFTQLSDVIDEVGVDVARFFYLNRKAEAHLEFDLATALKKTDENPVFYIQYAYVRINSLLEKAQQHEQLYDYLNSLLTGGWDDEELVKIAKSMTEPEFTMFKKIMQIQDVLHSIQTTYQTHLLSYYTLELAQAWHNYYTINKIIDIDNIGQTKVRLFAAIITKDALEICLDLLGLSKPEKM